MADMTPREAIARTNFRGNYDQLNKAGQHRCLCQADAILLDLERLGFVLAPLGSSIEMREAGRAVHQRQEQEGFAGKIRMRFDLVDEIYRAMLAQARREILGDR